MEMFNVKKTLIIAIVLANMVGVYAAWTVVERVEVLEEKTLNNRVMTEIGAVNWLDLVKRANVIENRQKTLRTSLAVEYVPERVVPATYKANSPLLHFHQKEGKKKFTVPIRQTKVPDNG